MHFCYIKGHILGQKSLKIEKNLRNHKLHKISSKVTYNWKNLKKKFGCKHSIFAQNMKKSKKNNFFPWGGVGGGGKKCPIFLPKRSI